MPSFAGTTSTGWLAPTLRPCSPYPERGRTMPVAWNEFVMGLDLGPVSDYSAPCTSRARQHPAPTRPGRWRKSHAVRPLQRWPLQTAYPEIVADTAALASRLPATTPRILCIDVTGVGRAVYDLFARARGQMPG